MDASDPSTRHALAVRMAELAREIAAPRTLERVLADVTAAAVAGGRVGLRLGDHRIGAGRARGSQAKGIIMERFDVDDVRAFELLRALSQESQLKLIDIAQRVIDSRGGDG